tara:strand:- start:2305 stop:3927 length:1623 start_codon:yes stop_codon:yes gene_type:complete
MKQFTCVGGWLIAGLLWFTSVVPVSAESPKLLVLLVVDQFRADYVETYGGQWSGGLRRLIDNGAWFTEAAYPYLNTVTCAGHATIATGAYPSTHGMISNSWWDRALSQSVRCTFDPDVEVVSYGIPQEPGESPNRLRVPTLSDELRLQLDSDARVVTFSLKERSAIMLGGHLADVVTWFGRNNAWVTSSVYTKRPIPFLDDFIQASPIEVLHGTRWSRTLAATNYLYEDDIEGERPPANWEGTFPHLLEGEQGLPDEQFYERWRTSPYSDEALGQMAVAALEQLQLGQRASTDYLAIGFSALDHVGHRFGPKSHEVQDVLIRLDTTLGRLLDELDRWVGQDRYVVGLSADHGVSPIPEQMIALGFDAGRIRSRLVREHLESVLEQLLGLGPHVAGMAANSVYLVPTALRQLAQNPQLRVGVLEGFKEIPGIQKAFFADTLAERRLSEDDLERAAALSYYPGRTGDLVYVLKPYWMSGAAASHGTANFYDRRVPVVLFGANIKAGRYASVASPADIAPTMAHLVGVTLAQVDGRVLAEALQ